MATVYDVIDNFFSNTGSLNKELDTLSGIKIRDFAEEVHRYSENFEFPQKKENTFPIYLGGWPSANIWNVGISAPTFISLLYSGQLLAKDPISDWFSPDQYNFSRVLPSRPGFIKDISASKIEWNIPQTRAFLKNVIPQLYRIRSLVESGLIVLAPSMHSRSKNSNLINKISTSISDRIFSDAQSFCTEFSPLELPLDDNVRGMFPFAGGNREAQIKKKVIQSCNYIVSEYLFSKSNGFDFVAPYRFEEYVCDNGISKQLGEAQGSSVITCLLSSNLPLIKGITPEALISVRDDENFSEFRGQLFELYGNAPVDNDEELSKYLAEVENSRILPILQRIQKDASGGVLSKIGLNIGPSIIRIGGGVIGASISTTITADPTWGFAAGATAAGIAAEIAGQAAGEVKKIKDKIKGKLTRTELVWKKLMVPGINADSEISNNLSKKKAENIAGPEFWGIPEIPGKSVTITQGTIIADFLSTPSRESNGNIVYGSEDNRNGPCSCRSGKKYKHCCRNLPDPNSIFS